MTSALGFALLGIFGRATGLAQLLCGRIAGLLALLHLSRSSHGSRPSTDSFRRASAIVPADDRLGRSFRWRWRRRFWPGPSSTSSTAATGSQAIPLVPFAVGAAALAALVQTGYTLLLAHGRQGQCLVADAWRLAGTLLALALFLPSGARMYLVALCGLHAVSLIMVMVFLWRDRAVTSARHRAGGRAAACRSAALAAVVAASRGRGLGRAACRRVRARVHGRAALLFPAPFAELVGYLPQSARVSRWLRFAPRGAGLGLPVRVLIVTPEYPPHAGGGILKYYRALAPALARQGCQVTVLVAAPTSPDFLTTMPTAFA